MALSEERIKLARINRQLCTVCEEFYGFERYNQHGLHIGRACNKCFKKLPIKKNNHGQEEGPQDLYPDRD